jgi:hypothetical protein
MQRVVSGKNTMQRRRCCRVSIVSYGISKANASLLLSFLSGQGVNSALMDSAVLADAILNSASLDDALLTYSQQQVPEGKALYELSFGPKPSLKLLLKTARDFIFKGKFGIGDLPLQTLLTTSLDSFASVRRQRDGLYETPFPDAAYWDETISDLDLKAQKNR